MTGKKISYQAWGNAGKVVKDTPQEAAQAYFQEFPRSRKCNVVRGFNDGHFYTVFYGRASLGEWPTIHQDVTKKQAQDDGFWKREGE